MVVDVTKLEAEIKSFLFIGHGDPLIKGSRIIYYILSARLSLAILFSRLVQVLHLNLNLLLSSTLFLFSISSDLLDSIHSFQIVVTAILCDKLSISIQNVVNIDGFIIVAKRQC